MLLAWLPAASPLGAACACSITASVNQPDLTLTSTSSGGCERLTGMVFLVDGGQVGNSAQFSVSTWTAMITTTSACLRTGAHNATANCLCGEPTPESSCGPVTGTASTSFSVSSTPAVSVSAAAPNDLGQVQLTVSYSFPNTLANTQRQLGVQVDGVDGPGASSNTVAGTWTPVLETSCLSNGSHQVRVQATACKMPEDPAFVDVDTTAVQVDHQPQVSLALTPADPRNPEGLQTARATYHFPQTAVSLQRTLKLIAYPSQRILFAFHPAANPGTASTDVGCIPNDTVALVATAQACGDSEAQDGAQVPGCPRTPRKDNCEEQCGCLGPGGGAPPWGGGPGGPGGPPTGPGARLHYLAGGVGNIGNPGKSAWNAFLGRNWSHDYAERIVADSSVARRVWLLTRFASFVQFDDTDGDGLYEKVSPEDEYRTLTKVGSGWQLRDLQGTVEAFDSAGLWLSTTDRNGNAKTATYSAGRLASVMMPDGRSETFAYDATTGKLATITEVGVGGAAQRVWRYTWSGLDLISIERPDGTRLRFVYGDPRLPGYMTRWILVGADDGDPATPRPERVEVAYEYGGLGNVVRAWRGSDDFATGVERYEMAYDNPFEPTKTTVTIHRSDTQTDTVVYTFSRTANGVGAKPRITSISGDCPSCGLAPSSTLFYDDPANPLRPTRTIDGRGIETQFVYDAHGQVIQKTEAAGTPLARTTTWAYHPLYPALPTRIETPSTAGGTARRVTVLTYDEKGNLTSRRIQGVEAGSFFDLATVTDFNTVGQPLTIDPPGYGGEDRTNFTYDLSRGGLLPLTRTDPLVGTTSFEYDPFNQRTAVTDSNEVRTETAYDNLNRALTVIQKGASSAEDLITVHEYDGFGDLLRTTLPRGNVVEYGCDSSGRLTSIERKPDATTPGERTFYTLDLLGNRIKEELQRWDGTSWVTESFTDYLYVNRCQIGKVVHAGTATTEYTYDCDGNLEKVWDANHPRQGASAGDGGDCDEPPCSRPNAPTQTYQYDALNRLIGLHQPWAEGGEAVTGYAYDVQDHLTVVTDAEGNITTYTYSDRDLMTQEASPVSSTTSHAYNEHGQMATETDGRGITSTRTIDALDRVTLIDFPDNALDTTYTYDDPAVPFSKGRLTKIARSGSEVPYAYDRFGRVTQDAELTYQYDDNGNRTEIGYPGGVTARFTHDFADREASLEIQVGNGAPQSIVSGATYKPLGPLSGFTSGNGLTEIRSYDGWYSPLRIQVPSRLDQAYTTDGVGNISRISRTVGTAQFVSTFAYKDPQYFLTDGNGPWGRRIWAYDRIGNRLSEGPTDIDPTPETHLYSYQLNPSGGHTPKLSRIEPAPGGNLGSRVNYSFDAAGNETTVTTLSAEGTGRTNFLDYSAESRLAKLRTSDGPSSTELLYDGRGFLRRSRLTATNTNDFEQTEPVYTSEGLLLARRYHKQTTQVGRGDTGGPPTGRVTMETTYLFYFDGRPVAQLKRPQTAGSSDTLLYLTTDHLGTPIQATDTAGVIVWEGGLEPFGAPFVFPRTPPPGEGGGEGRAATGTSSAMMESAGIFLRYPGQWDDSSFRTHGLSGGLYYNLNRWYQPGTGRYTSEDLLQWKGALSSYTYAVQNPLHLLDPFGLTPVTNNSGQPIPYKPENQDNTILLCMPGDTCDADGVYPPSCRDFPIKMVSGCTGEVRADGKLVVRCPFFSLAGESLRRKFPWLGQAFIGGRTDAQFHRDHPDWLVPNGKPSCDCQVPSEPKVANP